MSGIECAAAWVAAEVWRTARAAAGATGATVDSAAERGMRRVFDLVTGKLPHDPALRRLQTEAAANANDRLARGPRLSPVTEQAAVSIISRAAQIDPDFRARLEETLSLLGRPPVGSSADYRGDTVVGGDMTTTASGGGMAAGRDIHHSTTSIRRGAGIAGVVLVLAVAAGTAWHYVPLLVYQHQVTAACDQMHDTTSQNHSEALILDVNPGKDFNGDMSQHVKIKRDTLLLVMTDRRNQVSATYQDLAQRTVPGTLKDDKAAADTAFKAWSDASQHDIDVTKSVIKDGETVAAANAAGYGQAASTEELPGIHFNSALSKLAGKTCTAIAAPAAQTETN